MVCLASMTGVLIPTKIHGTVEDILFALAISSAPALHGLTKILLGVGCAGEPGCVEVVPWSSIVARREGERSGDEKDRR